MEQTFYMIKPEAINSSNKIHSKISSQFKIIESLKIALTEELKKDFLKSYIYITIDNH